MSAANAQQLPRLPAGQQHDQYLVAPQLTISRQTSVESERDLAFIELDSLQSIQTSPSRSTSEIPLRGAATPNTTEPSGVSSEPLIPTGLARKEATAKTSQNASRLSILHSRAVILMVIAFVAGIGFSLGHHYYYHWLNGKAVGTTSDQQWALRFGNAFAFLAKCCFCASTQIAFTQWLWRTLRRKYISIQGIDAAFSANETLISLCNLEMLSKMKVLTLLAIATWCIPLVALVTPATLSIKASSLLDNVTASVPIPIIPQNLPLNLSQDYPYDSAEALSKWASLTGSSSHQAGPIIYFDDVSPRFANLILSTATTGQLFSINPPTTDGNSTYTVDFIAPRVLCDESSPMVARNTTIAAFLSRRNLTSNMRHDFIKSAINFENLTYYPDHTHSSSGWKFPTYDQLGYYAMIPFEDAADPINSYLSDSADNGYKHGNKNEIWIVVAYRSPDTEKIIPTFLTCQLWNATWTVGINTTNNIQKIQVARTKLLNKVNKSFNYWGVYKNYDGPRQLNLNQALYTVFFRGVAKHLLGSMGLSVNDARRWSVRLSDVHETVLTSSTEFVRMLRSFNTSWDGSTLNALPEESHKPIKAMIEEFSQNVTLNLMTEDFFSTRVNVPVERVRSTNVYTYGWRNLLLAYGIAAISSLVIIGIGTQAIWSNGMSYGLNVSTVICTTQNPDISEAIGDRTTGSQPLAKDIARTKLRFGIVRADSNGPSRTGFSVEGTVSALLKQE